MDLLIPPPPELGNLAVGLAGAGAKVGEARPRWLFRGLEFSLQPRQCTGVVGRNGMGKTTLLRLCQGERPPDEGTVTIGNKVIFNYIDQTRLQLQRLQDRSRRGGGRSGDGSLWQPEVERAILPAALPLRG